MKTRKQIVDEALANIPKGWVHVQSGTITNTMKRWNGYDNVWWTDAQFIKDDPSKTSCIGNPIDAKTAYDRGFYCVIQRKSELMKDETDVMTPPPMPDEDIIIKKSEYEKMKKRIEELEDEVKSLNRLIPETEDI